MVSCLSGKCYSTEPKCSYICRGNLKQRNKLFDIIRSERSVTDTALSRDPEACFLKACTYVKTKSYIVESTGASVTTDSSVNLIHRYCEKLPSDRYGSSSFSPLHLCTNCYCVLYSPPFFLFGPSSQCPVHLILICLLSKCRYYTPKPIFKYKSAEEAYECELTLPSNAPFQTIVGPTSRNKNLSKQLVCLEACEKLHQVGALNDHLLPSVEEPSENNLISKKNESLPGAGMHMYFFV